MSQKNSILETYISKYSKNTQTKRKQEIKDFVNSNLEKKEKQELPKQESLYLESKYSLQETLLALLKLKTEHNLNNTTFESILNVIGDILPSGHKLPSTFFTFESKVESLFGKFEEKIVCVNDCCVCVEKEEKCKECGSFFFEEQKARKKVILFSVEDQLKKMFSSPLFSEWIKYPFKRKKPKQGEIHDIYDGNMWKNSEFFLSGNFGIIAFCDGLPLFKSSYSIHVLCGAIANLPPALRTKKENLLIFSIYPGPSPPQHFKAFLYLFKEQMLKFYKGFQIQNTLQRGSLLMFIADTVEKKKLMGLAGHNAYYGCFKCEVKGDRADNKTIYPVVGNLRKNSELKIKHGNTGVEILSPLLEFDEMGFDMIKGFCLDPLHLIFLGVVKKITNMWFDSKNSQKAFYIKPASRREIVDNLQSIIVFHDMDRGPAHIQDKEKPFQNFKGVEWMRWLLYWSPIILKPYLLNPFYSTWQNFSSIINFFCSNQITLSVLNTMKKDLQKVVGEFESQYGKGILVHNTHNLLHLTDEIESWGPLWTFWSFPFESFLGTIKKMPFGTKNPELLISKTLLRNKELPSLLNSLNPQMKFLKERENKKINKINDSTFMIGKLSLIDTIDFQKKVPFYPKKEIEVQSFKRLLKDNIMYHSLEWKSVLKSDSTSIEYTDESKICYAKILEFFLVKEQNIQKIFAFVETYLYENEILKKNTTYQKKQLIPVQNIQRKVIFVPVDEKSFSIVFPFFF